MKIHLLGLAPLLVALLGACCAIGPESDTDAGASSNDGEGDTCYPLPRLACTPSTPAPLEALCAEAFGAENPDPVLCSLDVWPDGNCRPLDNVTMCGGESYGVWCCGTNNGPMRAP
jgi:hypothetical protein